ncbi:hypothetical protein K5D38_11570 [Pseudomonas cichorii]|nr:hypothetical protein [Pseudomonas cichorii]
MKMLVYANRFEFEPEEGVEQIIKVIAVWAGRKAMGYVDPEKLIRGVNSFTIKDFSISSWSTVGADGRAAFPFLFSFRLVHQDESIKGRRWITEVGVRQSEDGGVVDCSVLLKTDEVSAKVVAPIKVTRPKLVADLVERCRPVNGTPGLFLKTLTEEGADAFLQEIERVSRKSPIVLISSKDGSFFTEPETLRRQVLGLAHVVVIPPHVDTFKLEEIVGRRFIAFAGAARVIFPGRATTGGVYCETDIFMPEIISGKGREDITIESKVLAAVTHRSNVALSRKHVSIEAVRFEVFRSKLGYAAEQAKSTENSDEIKYYAELLDDADKELLAKGNELEGLHQQLEDMEADARKSQATIEALKHKISGHQSNEFGEDDLGEVFLDIRNALTDIKSGCAKLEDALRLVSVLYSDRLVVLGSAFSSAAESDKAGFNHTNKAYDLLVRLVSEYWEIMADGSGDQKAKKVFGSSFSANEAGMSNEGKKRRTFSYRGHNMLMERHLKYGVKDSLAETLRVHFGWVAKDKKIVIGHCGKHLDF